MSKCPLCKAASHKEFFFTKKSFFYAGKEYVLPVFYIRVLQALYERRALDYTYFKQSPQYFHQAIRVLRMLFLDERIPYTITNKRGEGYYLWSK